MLKHENTEELMKKIWGMKQKRIPIWQKWLLNAMMPLLRYYVTKKVDTSEETVNQAKINMRKHFDDVR